MHAQRGSLTGCADCAQAPRVLERTAPVSIVAFSSDGRALLLTAGDARGLLTWTLATGAPEVGAPWALTESWAHVRLLQNLSLGEQRAEAGLATVACAADGRVIFVADGDRVVALATGRVRAARLSDHLDLLMAPHARLFSACLFSPAAPMRNLSSACSRAMSPTAPMR
jgi:hypothetical protein